MNGARPAFGTPRHAHASDTGDFPPSERGRVGEWEMAPISANAPTPWQGASCLQSGALAFADLAGPPSQPSPVPREGSFRSGAELRTGPDPGSGEGAGAAP